MLKRIEGRIVHSNDGQITIEILSEDDYVGTEFIDNSKVILEGEFKEDDIC